MNVAAEPRRMFLAERRVGGSLFLRIGTDAVPDLQAMDRKPVGALKTQPHLAAPTPEHRDFDYGTRTIGVSHHHRFIALS